MILQVLLTILESAVRPVGTFNVMSNVALSAGSSQHGKQRLASVGSNWVTAACSIVPSSLKTKKFYIVF